VVSAGAVVFADVPPYTVVAGNPARILRSLRDRPPAPAPPPVAPPPVAVSYARVEAASVVREAGPIVRESWVPPVLHCSDAYLGWQFGFPGPPALAVLARCDGDPAGFIAITPRRFRFRGAASHGFLFSFAGIRPSLQGRGLASTLYAEIMTAIRDQGLPTVAFIEAHLTRSMKLLTRTAERVGLTIKFLGHYANHGYVPHGAQGAPAAREARGVDEALAVIDACADPRVLWAAPDAAELEHQLRDPRGRKILVVAEEGRITGGAAVMLAEVVNKAGGIDRVTTVDALFVPDPTPGRIAALFEGAARAFAGQATTDVVSAPNVATLPSDVVRAAGLRRTGALYLGMLLEREGHPFLEADVTNVEVV
jgi:GNAT superfamily N-acetyltransferase